MKDIERKIRELLADRNRIESMLLLEKERKGVSKDNLLFLGMANIAGYSWCAMQSLFKSRKDEIGFFIAYLEDRLRYSLELDRIAELPSDNNDLLKIGSNITFKDIQRLLKEKTKRAGGISDIITYAIEFTNENGVRVAIINPDLPLEEKQWHEKQAKFKNLRVASPEEFPKVRGEFWGTTKAEKYPTIRWNFEWGKYVLVGVPDGITDKFVYEFKTTRNTGLLRYIKPVAHNQADLYGFFFKRGEKKIQIYIVDSDRIETWQDRINKSQAEAILEKFSRVDTGELPLQPKNWKCKHCEFKPKCPLNLS